MDGVENSFVKGVRTCNKCVSRETRIRKDKDNKDACLQWGERDVNCKRECKTQKHKCKEYENVCIEKATKCVKNQKTCSKYENGNCKVRKD